MVVEQTRLIAIEMQFYCILWYHSTVWEQLRLVQFIRKDVSEREISVSSFLFFLKVK